jgi:hypothetical protein
MPHFLHVRIQSLKERILLINHSLKQVNALYRVDKLQRYGHLKNLSRITQGIDELVACRVAYTGEYLNNVSENMLE